MWFISADALMIIAATTMASTMSQRMDARSRARWLSAGAVPSFSSHEAYSALNVCSERGSLRSIQAATAGEMRMSQGVSRVVMAETATAIEWMPIVVMEEAFSAIAAEVGTDVASLHERVATVSVERTFRTVWRVLLRLTTDKALVSRTPLVFARSYNRGRLAAEVPRPGRGEITLFDWPNVPAWPQRATRIGIATVLRVAGRSDVRVEMAPTPTGARYVATWR